MISVLFLIPTLDRGGAENVLVDLVNQMDQRKFDITVQTLFDKNSQKKRLCDGIHYKSFLYYQFHGNSRLIARIPSFVLYRFIIRKKYDIVISYLEGPTSHIIAGCPYSETKKVAWFHSALDTDKGFQAGFSNKSEALKVYEQLDMIVFVSDTVKDTIERVAGKPFSKSCVLHNTLNINLIHNKAKEKTISFSYAESEFNIISTGKITPVKGYDRLAKIQKRLRDNGYPTHVYILGKGSQKKEIEEYICKNNIEESFTFLGFQENPYNYIVNADLFVCSSRREGYSTAVSEALALGIPVISTDCSGAKELLGSDNEYGIVTDNNEEALFNGIKSYLDDVSLQAHYRQQAKVRGKLLCAEKTVKDVEGMLTRLADNH